MSGLRPLKNRHEPTAVRPIRDILRSPCVQSTYGRYRGTSDGSKKKQLSGQLIFDDSVKRLWAIRRYGNVVCLTCFLFCRACVWEIRFSAGHYQLVVSSLTITSWIFGLGEQDKGTDRCVMVLGSHSSVAPGGCYHVLFGGMTIRDPGIVGWAISIDCCVL